MAARFSPWLLVVLLLPGWVWAQTAGSASRPVLTIPRVQRAPTVDDFLAMEPAPRVKESLAQVQDFIQERPDDGQSPTQRTVVYAGYDETRLYVIFVCYDNEPDLIRGRMGRREDIFSDDRVEVWLDTFKDQRRAYVFATNALGIQRDATWTEGQGFDGSFDTLWYTEGRRTGQGYVVWMAIPFKSIRFPGAAEQSWGVLFKRDVGRYNEDVFWPRVTSRVEGRLNQAATLSGLSNISPGRNIQLIPYASFRSFRALDERDPLEPRFQRDRSDPDIGLDAKFVLKDSLVLDVALNPDFSQVESDEPQVTVNQRFEVFFPERRPFFIENAGFFETPINLVFTRRIADPQFGARLTGKLGPYALGVFVIDDESPGKSVADGDPLAGKRALFGIMRVSRDIFRQSSLGFIYTDREFEGDYNRVAGLDGRLKLSSNWVANFQAVTSWTRLEDGTELAGPAYDVELEREGRSFEYEFEYNDRSPGFRTQTGFVPRTDIRRFNQVVSYRWWPEGSSVLNWGPRLAIERIYDHEDTRLDWTASPSFGVSFTRQTAFEVFYNAARERLRPQDHPQVTTNLDFSTPSYGFEFESSFFPPLAVALVALWGKGINLVPRQGPPVLAKMNDAELEITYRPITPLRIDNTYIFSRLKDRDSGANIFNNHIVRSNWNYQFTRELSLRFILQYDTTLSNSEFTSLETTKNLNADVLITYLPHPGTALFIGYNGNAQNIDLIPTPVGAELIHRRNRFINDAKQFFVKFSYLYRF